MFHAGDARQATRHPDRSAEAPSRHDVVVLLADDFDDGRELYRDYLLSKGYRVVTAADGSQALEQARACRPSLALLDVRMPGLSGTEVMLALRDDPALGKIPIVALTSHALDDEREMLLERGFDCVLSKPCLPEEVAVAVARLIRC